MYSRFLVLILLTVSSCQNKNEIRHLVWKSGDSEKTLNEINDIEQVNVSEIIYKGQKIKNLRQSYDGSSVDKSSLKKVYDKNDKIYFAEANVLPNYRLSKLKKIQLTNKNELQIAGVISKIHPDVKVSAIKNSVVISYTHAGLEQLYDAQFETPDGRWLQILFDSNLKFISENLLGSQLSTVESSVYFLGPKFSVLSDVSLQVEKSPMLASRDVFVDSQSENKITTVGSSLKFDPKDERFEQVQVFYYLNKLRQWVKDKLDIQFTNRIDVEVNVGYPKKTNTAFYFQNKIRLGRGDDVDYSNIALDPSIVLHEGFHSVIDGLANLPFQGQGGSLNEGYADFYTAVMLNRPYLGETAYLKAPFKRTVNNDLKLSDANEGLYHDSGIISGLLWDLKAAIGEESTLQVATAALAQLNHFSEFKDFNEAMLSQIQQTLPQEKRRVAYTVLKRRGFRYE